jgi:hypothetical protein
VQAIEVVRSFSMVQLGLGKATVETLTGRRCSCKFYRNDTNIPDSAKEEGANFRLLKLHVSRKYSIQMFPLVRRSGGYKGKTKSFPNSRNFRSDIIYNLPTPNWIRIAPTYGMSLIQKLANETFRNAIWKWENYIICGPSVSQTRAR